MGGCNGGVMGCTEFGSLKRLAKWAGISLEEYLARTANGEKRCTKCKQWKTVAEFGLDRSRRDGRDATCFVCRRVRIKKNIKGRPSAFKGHHHSDNAKAKMSAAHLGLPSPKRGVPRLTETRLKISISVRKVARRGASAPGYIDGKSTERYGLRASSEIKRWRYDVFARDGFACCHCGEDRGGNLNAHHILPFAKYPAFRLDLENGITLCKGCHHLAHEHDLWSYPYYG